MNEYVTYEFLGTFAGLLVVLNLIVQFLKLKIDKVWKIPTRFIVWVIAILLLTLVQAVTSPFTLESVGLILLNAVPLTLAAMGSYSLIIEKLEKK